MNPCPTHKCEGSSPRSSRRTATAAVIFNGGLSRVRNGERSARPSRISHPDHQAPVSPPPYMSNNRHDQLSRPVENWSTFAG
jgi:hypothetical protein